MYYKKAFDFNDVIFEPVTYGEINSRSLVSLRYVPYITHYSKKQLNGLPIINAPMDSIGSPNMVNQMVYHGMYGCLGKYYQYDAPNPWVFKTYGLESEIPIDRMICLDIANGYLKKFLNFVKKTRDYNPTSVIMAGNVCTPDGAIAIFNAGADIVKVGIAQGGHCDTKNKAGVGLKQASTIYEIAQEMPEGVMICSDGGIKKPADIGKAIGLGAHFVMIGTMLAGYDENDGEWIYKGIWPFRKKVGMRFYGMSSHTANLKHNGGLSTYRTSEGLETIVPYKGPIKHLFQDICGSLASTCTYLNIDNLSLLRNHPNLRCIS